MWCQYNVKFLFRFIVIVVFFFKYKNKKMLTMTQSHRWNELKPNRRKEICARVLTHCDCTLNKCFGSSVAQFVSAAGFFFTAISPSFTVACDLHLPRHVNQHFIRLSVSLVDRKEEMLKYGVHKFALKLLFFDFTYFFFSSKQKICTRR